MRPGNPKWATNDNHAAGPDPWSGQPAKVPPSAGKIATGRLPEERPPAEETNWWRWAAALVLTACSSMRAVNYQDGDMSAVGTAGTGIAILLQYVEYDPVSGYWAFATGGAGANVCEEVYSHGGVIWEEDTPAGWGGLAMPVYGYSINPINGERAVSLGAADQLLYTTAGYPGLWAQWNGIGATGNTYAIIENSGTLWVVYNVTTGNLEFQSSPLAPGPPAAGATQPGFGGGVVAIKHSRHAAAEVDPSDAGNLIWMAVTLTEVSTSADGDNWTPAVAHGIANAAHTVAYTASSRRWHLLDPSAGNLQHCYSDDNGVSWTAGTVIDTPANDVQARLASDRYGTLVCITIDSVTKEAHVYATVDDGETWVGVVMPASIASNGGTTPLAGFGDGRFMLVVEDGVDPATYYPYYGLATIDQ